MKKRKAVNYILVIQMQILSAFTFLSWILCVIAINNCEGFGCQANFSTTAQIMIKNQVQLNQALLRNFTEITFPPSIPTIPLQKQIVIINKTNIIIKGTAQLFFFGISIIGSSNIKISQLRIFNASIDGILISNSKNIVISQNTILDASRESIEQGKCIDVTQNSSNITISKNIIGYTADVKKMIKNKGMLIFNFYHNPVTNISIHHNVFYCNYQRNPQISPENISQASAGCLFDLYQNVIFNWTEYGTRVRGKAFGNIVQNLYIGQRKDPLIIQIDQMSNQGIFSVRNQGYKNHSYYRISDCQTHQRYEVPSISSKSYAQTIKQSGVQNTGKWENLIERNIISFINSSDNYFEQGFKQN